MLDGLYSSTYPPVYLSPILFSNRQFFHHCHHYHQCLPTSNRGGCAFSFDISCQGPSLKRISKLFLFQFSAKYRHQKPNLVYRGRKLVDSSSGWEFLFDKQPIPKHLPHIEHDSVLVVDVVVVVVIVLFPPLGQLAKDIPA